VQWRVAEGLDALEDRLRLWMDGHRRQCLIWFPRVVTEPLRATVTAAVAALVLALAGSGTARGGPTAGEQTPVDALSLEQQVGQLVVLSFAGRSAPDYVLEALRERKAAGVILFGGNIESASQLLSLTDALRDAGGRPIVAVDQEGGSVRRIPWAPPVAPEPQQVAAGTAGLAARKAAASLRTLGITVALAPVADVPSVPSAAIAGRAFSSDPAVASRAVASAVAGWRRGGIASTAKHFPGLGGARRNTDAALVTIRRSRAQLEATDLPPFEAAVEAGVPLVMVGHARYPALDRANIASQSRRILGGLLRGQLGFRGVVITDSMEAQASLATGSVTVASERAVRAGADIVLLTGRGSYAPVYRHLLEVARASPSFRARVRESAARVLALVQRGARPPR
jgi:beta-N-acetylhexosaminidase